MAMKKFSRLSILLEAKDKMSRVFNNASNSSRNLGRRIDELSGSTDRNRNSIAKNIAKQRILSDKYRELARTLGQTNEKSGILLRTFDKMPKSIRYAAYYIEGYTRQLGHLILKNRLATTTFKVVTNTFKYTGIALWNIADGARVAARGLYNMSGAAKLVRFISDPIKNAAARTMQLAKNTTIAVKALSLYKSAKNNVKEVANNIKLAAQAQVIYAKGTAKLLQNSKAWKLVGRSIQGTKNAINGTLLSFTLLKNSSKTVDKIGNAFKKVISPVTRLNNILKTNILNMRHVSNAADRLGRGRATFNQLADANQRLNKQLAKMNAELSRANNRLGSMRSSLGNINMMGAAFSAAFAGQAAVNVGTSVTTDTVGYAMEQQYSSESVGILAGAENGAKFYKQIVDYAAQTAYSSEEWSRNMRGAISKSKTIDDLEVYQTALEQLATLDPVQGLDGAALAVRELNSGDSLSLVERFELPRGEINKIKHLTDPIEQTRKLIEIVGKETGYTVENIAKMKELPLMQWQKATNIWKTMKGYMGQGALQVIAPYIEKFNKLWDEGKFAPYIQAASDKMASFAQGLINFVSGFAGKIDSLKEKNAGLLGLVDNIVATYEEAKPKLSGIFSDLIDIVNQAATMVSQSWPIINTVIQKTLDIVKSFTGFVNNNFPLIVSSIAGVATAFTTWKIITAVTKALALLRTGTLLATIMNSGFILSIKAATTAMLANPIGLVISLLAGLAVGLYFAYQKSETFRNAVQAAWGWIKEKGAAALEVGKGAIDSMRDALKSATDWVQKMWDKWLGFVDGVKNAKIDWGAIMPGGDKFITLGGKKESPDGRHKAGISNVPHDRYKAILHKGERVLTKQENDEYTNGGNGQVLITGNNFSVREEADIDKVADKLFRKLQEARGK